jgi:pSer/pThr/pTyr-binding forkhead associated (FHA) protein
VSGLGRAGKPTRAQRKVLRSQPSELVIVAGAAGNGSRFALGSELTVGRAPGCAICIDDGFASQLHARVYRSEKRIIIDDLGSTNGTLVNGERITTPTPLVLNDVITIGGTAIEVR